MLVLTRKANEAIIIDDVIEIVVCRVSHRRVMLGVKAPANVSILRGELEVRRDGSSVAGSTASSAPEQPAESCVR